MHSPPHPTDPLSASVLAAAFDVANTLGHGFLETVYRRALALEMQTRGLDVAQEIAFTVRYKGQPVGQYIADLIVGRRLLIELKCADRLAPAHTAQTFNYLRASGIPVALLINFGRPRLEWKRLFIADAADLDVHHS